MEEQIESDFPFQKVPAMLLFILLESTLNHTLVMLLFMTIYSLLLHRPFLAAVYGLSPPNPKFSNELNVQSII